VERFVRELLEINQANGPGTGAAHLDRSKSPHTQLRKC